jgi:hypothetical protein
MRGLLKGVVRKFENRAGGGGELGDQVEGRNQKGLRWLLEHLNLVEELESKA